MCWAGIGWSVNDAIAQGNATAAMPEGEPRELPTFTVLGRDPGAPPQTETSAVSLFSGSLVNDGSVQSVRELKSLLPSLSIFDSDNDRTPRFSTRGLRENNFARGEAAVGLYVDDVPYADLVSRGLRLYDVDRGAFLRGPQGTLYGVSGPGGVLTLHTRQPGNEFYGSGSISYGNYDRMEAQLATGGPIAEDRLAIGVAGVGTRRDGFVYNRTLDTHPDDKEDLGGRVQLRWTPSEPWEITLAATAEQFNDGFVPTYYPGVDANMFDVSRDTDGYVDTRAFGQSLRVQYRAETFQVTSITSHRTWEQDLLQDFDFSPVPGVLGFSRPELDQWTQEVRMQSLDPVARIRWLGGVFFADRQLDYHAGSIQPLGQPIPFPPGFVPGPLTRVTTARQDDQIYAAFGQVTGHVCSTFDVTGGLRLERNERSMRRNRVDDLLPVVGLPPIPEMDVADDFSAALPKAGLVYHCWSNHDLYLTATSGYQSGGFNASNDTPDEARYESSRSWHYELGHKADWIEDRFSTRVAAYYVNFDDYQIFRFNQQDPTQAVIVNADRVYSYGAEIELLAEPATDLELSALFSAGDARFDSFEYASGGRTYDFADRHVNFVPQFNLNLAVQYRLMQHWVARVEWQGVGEYYLDEGNTARQGAFGLLNLRLGYEHKHFGVYFFARNVFDQEYANNAIDFRNDFQPDLLIRQPGDPRSLGFVLSGRF